MDLNLLIVCLAVVGIAAMVVYAPRPKGGPLGGRLLTVHTRDDQTIHGLCLGESRDRLRLVEAEYLHNQGRTRVPDVVVVFREQIAWVQDHDAPERRGEA